MMLRPLLPALLLLSVLAPRPAEACSPLYGFDISGIYPAADAIGVPIDGVVAVVGESWSGATASIEVRLAGELVPGSVGEGRPERPVWRSSEPLLPDTQYSVHIEAESDEGIDIRDFTFTTGAEPATPPVAGGAPEAQVEGFEREIRECVVEADAGSCSDCDEWKVVEVESRMRLLVSVDVPTDLFAGFYASSLSVGTAASSLTWGDSYAYQTGSGGSMFHSLDLGVAGSWKGDQVCVKASVLDPLARSAETSVSCIDIHAINVAPQDDTDTDETGSSSGDESSGGPEGPGEDIEMGCDVRGADGPLWPGALLLLLGVGLRRRRLG